MYVPTMDNDPVDVVLRNVTGGNCGVRDWKDTLWSKLLPAQYIGQSHIVLGATGN